MIRGDIFPDLVTQFSDILAIPMTSIINEAMSSKKWPSSWKEETMVIIPKCNNPTQFGDLRNLSCTPLFSKILESFVFEKLKKEISIDTAQFGSTKGLSTEHYLINTWNHALEALEDTNSACNLISIDFSKAFNSLEHAKCLEIFKRQGASLQSCQMLYAFLEKRQMRVKIDGTFSKNPKISMKKHAV